MPNLEITTNSFEVMKRILSIIILFVGMLAFSPIGAESHGQAYVEPTEATVYICNGPYSKKYHNNKECRGLRNCSTSIESLEMETARARGRTACRICY